MAQFQTLQLMALEERYSTKIKGLYHFFKQNTLDQISQVTTYKLQDVIAKPEVPTVQ